MCQRCSESGCSSLEVRGPPVSRQEKCRRLLRLPGLQCTAAAPCSKGLAYQRPPFQPQQNPFKEHVTAETGQAMRHTTASQVCTDTVLPQTGRQPHVPPRGNGIYTFSSPVFLLSLDLYLLFKVQFWTPPKGLWCAHYMPDIKSDNSLGIDRYENTIFLSL